METVRKAILKNIAGNHHVSFIRRDDTPPSEHDILTALVDAICPTGSTMDDKRYQWIQGPVYLVDAVQRCETQHKGFNKHLDQVSGGNVISDIMRGQYIRPFNEVECNGRVNPPGHLQTFDINSFSSAHAKAFFNRHLSECINDMAIGYEFYTRTQKQKMPIAYLLVRASDRKVLASTTHANLQKYESVLNAMRLVLSSDGIRSKELVANVVGNTVIVYRDDLYARLCEMGVNCQRS